jgi:hypothetical protein
MKEMKVSFDLISKNFKNLDTFTRQKLQELAEGRQQSFTAENNTSTYIEKEKGETDHRQL